MYLLKPRTTLVTVYLTSLLGAFICGLPMGALAVESDPPVSDKPVKTQSGGPMFVPPKLQLPSRAAGDTTRGACTVPLLPVSNPIGLTVAEYPLFFMFVPKTSPQTVEFLLEDENKSEIYKTTFRITGDSGIISLRLPATATVPPLEIGKNYQWSFSLNCNPQDQADQLVFANGLIQRVEPGPTLGMQLQKATGRDRVAAYAAAGIWYDAVATLAGLRRANPTDPVLASDWEDLLKQVGLNDVAQQPLVQP